MFKVRDPVLNLPKLVLRIVFEGAPDAHQKETEVAQVCPQKHFKSAQIIKAVLLFLIL